MSELALEPRSTGFKWCPQTSCYMLCYLCNVMSLHTVLLLVFCRFKQSDVQRLHNLSKITQLESILKFNLNLVDAKVILHHFCMHFCIFLVKIHLIRARNKSMTLVNQSAQRRGNLMSQLTKNISLALTYSKAF